MNESFDILRMSRENFGYGRWDAPYWFIGPEQGQARDEDRTKRLSAWYELGCLSLNDCYEYHRKIGELRWHVEPVKLQATWRKLILTLLAFSDKSIEDAARRNYQKQDWGRASGESCVIELSGMAAPSLKEKPESHTQLDLDYLDQRIQDIVSKLQSVSPEPKFVIVYGTNSESCRRLWRTILDISVPISSEGVPAAQFRCLGRTMFAFVDHPTARGTTKEHWIKLGRELRIHSDRLWL